MKNGFFSLVSLGESPPLARSLLSHTVKELVSRGLKSRTVLGGVKPRTDRLSVSRVARFVATGKPYSERPPRVNTFFVCFLEIAQEFLITY